VTFKKGDTIKGEIVGGSNETRLFNVSIGGEFPFENVPVSDRWGQFFPGMDCVLGFINPDAPVIITKGYPAPKSDHWLINPPEPWPEPPWPDPPDPFPPYQCEKEHSIRTYIHIRILGWPNKETDPWTWHTTGYWFEYEFGPGTSVYWVNVCEFREQVGDGLCYKSFWTSMYEKVIGNCQDTPWWFLNSPYYGFYTDNGVCEYMKDFLNSSLEGLIGQEEGDINFDIVWPYIYNGLQYYNFEWWNNYYPGTFYE